MKLVVFPQMGEWRWILKDGVEVLALSQPLPDHRTAVENVREFKSEVAKAEIDTEEKPWWPTSTSSKQPSS